MGKYEYVNFQDKLYYVYRKLRVSQIKEQYIQDIKQIWCCDIVLKYPNQPEDVLFFLREAQELEILD